MKNLTLMKILAFQTAGDSHVCKTALLSMSNTEDYNYHSLPENNYFFSLSFSLFLQYAARHKNIQN